MRVLIVCPSCMGCGKVWPHKTATATVKCPTCNGKGEVLR